MGKGILISAAALALTACGGGDEPDTIAVDGLVSLHDDEIDGWWSDCTGTGGYKDFRAGQSVTVRDESGDIIATSNARNFTSDDLPTDGDQTLSDLPNLQRAALVTSMAAFEDDAPCYLYFDVEVPAADFYTFEFASRGEVTFSADELEGNDWLVEMSLGQ